MTQKIYPGIISGLQTHTTRSRKVQLKFTLTAEDGTTLVGVAWNELAHAIMGHGEGTQLWVKGYIATHSTRWHAKGNLIVGSVSLEAPKERPNYEDRDLAAGEVFIISEGPYEHAKSAIAMVLVDIPSSDISSAYARAQASSADGDWFEILAAEEKLRLFPAHDMIDHFSDSYVGAKLVFSEADPID